MNSLIERLTSQSGTLDRIQREMEVTMPSSDEVPLFLIDSIIRSELIDKKNRGLTPAEFIRYLDLDEKISKIRDSKISEIEKNKFIDEARKPIISAPIPEKIILPPTPKVYPS